MHDRRLLKFLGEKPQEEFSGPVWRARPVGGKYDPTTPANVDGRWASPEGPAVLYTSLEREGSLAEIAFHWGQFTPLIKRPAALYKLRLKTSKTLRLIRTDLESLDIMWEDYLSTNYKATAAIGDAVEWLGCDGLIAPNARWDCDNLMVFTNKQPMTDEYEIKVLEREEVDWITWARGHGFLPAAGLDG